MLKDLTTIIAKNLKIAENRISIELASPTPKPDANSPSGVPQMQTPMKKTDAQASTSYTAFKTLQKPEKEVLLNVNYPSRQEKDFLRHIERWQQEKNDLNYRRILQQLASGSDDQLATHGMDINRYNSLSSTKRGLVVQEDA